MNALNFQNLIQTVTGRPFIIHTDSENIEEGKEYFVYRVLPHTQRKVGFKWKAAQSNEKMLRSFITAFCSKYREPNQKAYDKEYGGKSYTWAEKTEQEKEYAYVHHVSNMFSRDALMKQVEDNFSNPNIEISLIRYGFYPTEYGVGIFCFWATDGVLKAIAKMKQFLNTNNIPYTNEFSDARWVYRFKLSISKEAHTNLLGSFTQD